MRYNAELNAPEITDEAAEWARRMPVVFISPRFPLEGILSGSSDVGFGYGVETFAFAQLGLKHIAAEQFFAAAPSVMTVIESTGSGHIGCGDLRHVLTFCRSRGLTPAGDAWGVTIGNCVENGVTHRYHRVYVPVRPEG